MNMDINAAKIIHYQLFQYLMRNITPDINMNFDKELKKEPEVANSIEEECFTDDEDKTENSEKREKKLLYSFCIDLLKDPNTSPSVVSWQNTEDLVFKIENGDKMAELWGKRKGNKTMDYEKLSRALRDARKRGYFEKQDKKIYGSHFMYKFGKESYKRSVYLRSLQNKK